MKADQAAVLVASLSAGIAVLALIAAVVSAAAARRSAREAETANDLATEANHRAQRAEHRATARNDVRLRTELIDDKLIAFNDGLDPALNTAAVLHMHSTNQTVHLDIGDVTIREARLVVDLKVNLDLAEQEARDRDEAMANSNVLSFSDPAVRFTQRLTWQDESGLWHNTEEQERSLRRDGY